MRLRSLCEALFLLCLCVVPSLAASGQTLSIRRPHQPRKVDRIIRTYLHAVTVATLPGMSWLLAGTGKDQTPVKPPFKSKTVVVPRTIAPRKLLVRRKTKLCRPILQCSTGKRFSTDGCKWITQPISQQQTARTAQRPLRRLRPKFPFLNTENGCAH